jgi:restriction system protein
VPYDEESPALRSDAELEGAVEHLEYAVFRRFGNALTRAERARLDNTIGNALFKVDRYLERVGPERVAPFLRAVEAIRERLADGRERLERRLDQARRAEARLEQLGSLTPEGFEEFVAELFEALGHVVEHVGGTGDEGADLRLERGGLRAVVQCKYHTRGVIGSPELQKFLGTVHAQRAHKGYFVTTRTFTLAAEKFAAGQPIELVDGPRLVELVHEALGPGSRRPVEPSLF